MTVAISIRMNATLVTKRSHNQIMRELNRELMETIRDKFWPKHFENSPETYPGAGGYGYERRSKRWQEQKQREKGHNKPLVYTGQLRRALRTNSKITATANGSKLKARGYFPLNAQRRREIEAVSNREEKQLVKEYEKKYIELANSPKYKRKRRPKTRRK